MTTYLRVKPTLQQRVRAAHLIVIGNVEKMLGSFIDADAHARQVNTVYEVRIRRVLKGEYAAASLKLRIMGGRAGGAETPWTVRVSPGEQCIFFLGRDCGPGKTEVEFVPYFRGCYAFDRRGGVKLSRAGVRELSGGNLRLGRTYTRRATLLSGILAELRAQRKEAAAIAAQLPKARLRRPYPAIAESPVFARTTAREAARPAAKGRGRARAARKRSTRR